MSKKQVSEQQASKVLGVTNGKAKRCISGARSKGVLYEKEESKV